MQRKHPTISLMLALLLVAAPAAANSVTYHISVTVPAIVGVNVPESTSPESASLQLADSTASSLGDVTVEQAVRQNETVMIRSITAK